MVCPDVGAGQGKSNGEHVKEPKWTDSRALVNAW